MRENISKCTQETDFSLDFGLKNNDEISFFDSDEEDTNSLIPPKIPKTKMIKEEDSNSNKIPTIIKEKYQELFVRVRDCVKEFLSLNGSDQNKEKKLNDEQLMVISDALESNSYLERIDLSGNDFGWKGLQYLSEKLKKNTILKEINLAENNVDDKAIKYLSESLKNNNTLEKLNLSNIKITGEVGIKDLSESLKSSVSIKQLNLSHNRFSENGMKYLTESFKINNSLEEIDLSFNKTPINDRSGLFLLDSFTFNKSLKTIHLTDHKMSDYMEKNILAFLSENKKYSEKAAKRVRENMLKSK